MGIKRIGLPILILSVFFVSFGCGKKPETLKEAYQGDFLIGTAVTTGDFQSQPFFKMYDEELINNFNLLVGENAMKPEVIYSWKGPDSYNYKYGDIITDYAAQHGMAVRGHVLIWHQQTPAKLVSVTMTKEEAQASMKEYIFGVMGHYKGKVAYWDVVNESVGNDPSFAYLEGSPWYIAYGGPEYLQDAFKFASEADPDAVLLYNDYSVVNADKRDRIVNMINELDLIDCGLDEIGCQAHWSLIWPTVDQIQETIDVFASMGLKVQFTELDIDCYNSDPNVPEMEYTEELEKQLAHRYEELFTCFRENKEHISAVTIWGIGDDHSWLHKFCIRPLSKPRTNYPLLFDAFGKPKEAYYKVLYLK